MTSFSGHIGMIEINLPYPPSALSPNARGFWALRANAAKKYRRHCWACALIRREDFRRAFGSGGKLSLELVFHPPQSERQKGDLDNLIARMKSGLDGVFDAFGTDDSRVDQIVSMQQAPKRRGLVIVRIRDGARDEP